MNTSIERVKVEILLDAPLADLVTRIVVEAGAGGYTILPALGGSGHNGRWHEDRVSGADNKVLLLAIATEQIADTIVRGLEPLLETHRLIVMTTRVGVVRGDKF
jgi:PII-like signaling protein